MIASSCGNTTTACLASGSPPPRQHGLSGTGGPFDGALGATAFREPRNRAERRALDRQYRKKHKHPEGKAPRPHTKAALNRRGEPAVPALDDGSQRQPVPTPPVGTGWLDAAWAHGDRLCQWLSGGATDVGLTDRSPAVDDPTEVCGVDGVCGATPVVTGHGVGALVEDARARGLAIEMSPSMKAAWRADPQTSLRGAIVMFGDAHHEDPRYTDAYFAMIGARYQFAQDGRGADRLLAESDGMCPPDGWVPTGQACECFVLDHPEAEALLSAKLDEAEEDARKVLRLCKRPVSAKAWTDIDSAYRTLIDMKMWEATDRGTKVLVQRFVQRYKALQEAIADTNGMREDAMFKHIGRYFGGADKTTYFVAGGGHTEHLRERLFEKYPVIYIWSTDMFKLAPELTREADPL